MSVPPRAVQLNEANAFLKEHPEVLYVDLLIADMNGVVRGKRIERTSLHKVYEKGINLPASLFALDINGSTVESTGLGLDIGDADRICYPIPDTLSNEPWQKRPTAQLLMTMHEIEGEPFFADPREVLRQVVAKFDELGLTICAAFELEFYLIDQENVNGRPQPPRSPISGKRPQSTQVYLIDDLDEYVDCLQDILEGAKEQGIPADAVQAPAASANLLNTLGSELKITPEQAIGGTGALLGLARNQLSSGDYAQLSKAVPGLDFLSGENALGGLAGLGDLLGKSGESSALSNALGGEVKNQDDLSNAFSALGLQDGMIARFAPLILQYLGQQGVAGSLLQNLAGIWGNGAVAPLAPATGPSV